jgi:ABC-2 type transport system permease protein
MSKLRSVIRHEYLTIVKQPSFWIIMISIPLIIAAVIGVSYYGNKTSSDRIEEIAKDLKNVTIIDQSGLINADVIAASGLTLRDSQNTNEQRELVRTGKKEALVVYPSDLKTSGTYRIYLSSDDFTKMGAVSTLGDSILKASLFLPLGSKEIISLAQNGATSDITVFKDGAETAGFNEYIAPGLFIILFYIIFAFSVGYMLTSVSEEKENRSMEMVLTYVNPRTLILGKLLGVSLVTLTQVAFFTLLAAISYVVLRQTGGTIELPFGIDLAKIVFDPLAIFFGAAFLIIGFLMFAGFMTATAAAAPSTKEANSFSTVFYIGAFVPFYFIALIATNPTNPVVTFLTFFPLTSPVVTLIRNTIGNMGTLESFAALAVMTVFMLISIWVAVRAFKLGALEFSQTIKLSSLFKR